MEANKLSTAAPRQSNMELLRIVAMLLVMIVHADFRALSVPSVADFDIDTVRTVMRLVFESLSIICVNTFVLLSGWFGIHFKFSRLWEFLFQIAFFIVLFYGLAVVTRPDEALTLSGASNLLLLGQWDYWFVKCYLMLYIFSPVLNAFVEHATRRQFATVLVLFYAVSHWNRYQEALFYLRTDSKRPLQLVLRSILFENSMNDMVDDAANLAAQMRLGELIKYGVIIASSLPLLILYPFLQRYFIQGVMIGAVKG